MGWLKRVFRGPLEGSQRTEAERETPTKAADDTPAPSADSHRYRGMGAGESASSKRRDGLPLHETDTCYADEYDAGFVRGKHFLKWGEALQALKRDGRLEEALALVMEIIDATEREQAVEAQNAAVRAKCFGQSPGDYAPRETPPGWTEQAAIILRKMGRLEDELAVIDRWIDHAGDQNRWVGTTQPKLLERRGKVVGMLAKRTG